jgi:hypothetical protein
MEKVGEAREVRKLSAIQEHPSIDSDSYQVSSPPSSSFENQDRVNFSSLKGKV